MNPILAFVMSLIGVFVVSAACLHLAPDQATVAWVSMAACTMVAVVVISIGRGL